MNITFKRNALALLSTMALAAASSGALAHDIVIVPERSGAFVRYGHAQDWQPLEKAKLLELQVFSGDAAPQERAATLKPKALGFVMPAERGLAGQPLLLAARYDNGLWAREAQVGSVKPKAHNTSRLMMPSAATVTNNLKFAKGLAGTAADTTVYKRTLGHLLELVPQSNPLALKRGEPLEVLVLFRGKPLANAGIEVGNLVDKIEEEAIKRYPTDASGIARVTLNERGINMLGVDHDQPNDGSFGDAAAKLGADKIAMTATYTFVRQ